MQNFSLMSPKVSIVVPCWGVEKYLDKCVESLVNQTLKDIEIILVDDESPDRVPQMCDDWAKRDSRIKVIHKKNGGLGFARNSGLKAATGKYVTFCDSDDWLELETYETTYNKAVEKDLDICWFQCYRVKSDGTKTPRDIVPTEFFIGKKQIDWFYLDVIGTNPKDPKSRNRNISSCMALFKRETIIKSEVLFKSERVIASEDFVFMLDFLPNVNKIGVLSNLFYNYRITEGSISQSFPESKYQRIMNMLDYLKSKCNHMFEPKDYKIHYYSRLMVAFKTMLKFRCIANCSILTKRKSLLTLCKDNYMEELYNDPLRNNLKKNDKIIVKCMKYRLWPFLILLYKKRYKYYS